MELCQNGNITAKQGDLNLFVFMRMFLTFLKTFLYTQSHFYNVFIHIEAQNMTQNAVVTMPDLYVAL